MGPLKRTLPPNRRNRLTWHGWLELGALWHGCNWSEVDLVDDPEVEEDGDTVTVRLYCGTGLGMTATFTEVDTYQRGSYLFESDRADVVATGPGYVH